MRISRKKATGLAFIGAAGVKILLTMLAQVTPELGPTAIVFAGLATGLVLVGLCR